MFTGIIEAQGRIQEITHSGSNTTFWVASNISDELKVDQSIAHNGVCLTVEAVANGAHQITAIQETLDKSNLGFCQKGEMLNLERCLQLNARIDGHMVQGHVDTVGEVLALDAKNGSWEITVAFPQDFAHLMVEKGSICLNGISLTAFAITRKPTFKVAIIPYTWAHTNLQQLQKGATVNLEFDILGKYVDRQLQLRQ